MHFPLQRLSNDHRSFLFPTQDFEKLQQLMQSHRFDSVILQNPPCAVDLARLTGFVFSCATDEYAALIYAWPATKRLKKKHFSFEGMTNVFCRIEIALLNTSGFQGCTVCVLRQNFVSLSSQQHTQNYIKMNIFCSFILIKFLTIICL